jgi:hypothetical protein
VDWKKNSLYFWYQTLIHASTTEYLKQVLPLRRVWLNSFKGNSISDELPWLNLPALQFLNHFVQPSHKVCEFGGGGSTLFFLKKTTEVVTIEDHADWFDTLQNLVREKNLKNWHGQFIPSTHTNEANRQPENPAHFKSGAKGLENRSFENYAKAIHHFPKNYFDIILVDGRARPSCIVESIPHLKSNGVLIVDNTERAYYLRNIKKFLSENFTTLLELKAPTYYTPDFTQTSIYQKR